MYGELEAMLPRCPIRRPEGIVRANALEVVSFQRSDGLRMGEFLTDFGFVAASASPAAVTEPGRRYFRARANDSPFSVEIIDGERDGFVGFGFAACAYDDLHTLSKATGSPVTDDERPGGGRRVRLRDLDGFEVDLMHGREPTAQSSTRNPITEINVPGRPVRVNCPIRTTSTPAPVLRLGHIVLQVKDLAASLVWYMHHFGFLASDVQLVGDGSLILAFLRFDRGESPTDHHSLALLQGPDSRLLHVSTETLDIDAVGQGHQYLRARGWTHHWGLGRHILGSQIFDYWKDSAGDEWEHYADGDMMTADYPTGYWKLALGSLWSWGDDLPPGLVPPGPPPPDAPSQVREVFSALSVPARPWIR
jgi:hypothetical protein